MCATRGLADWLRGTLQEGSVEKQSCELEAQSPGITGGDEKGGKGTVARERGSYVTGLEETVAAAITMKRIQGSWWKEHWKCHLQEHQC